MKILCIYQDNASVIKAANLANQRTKKRYLSAVPPVLAKALVQANLPELCIERKEEQAA